MGVVFVHEVIAIEPTCVPGLGRYTVAARLPTKLSEISNRKLHTGEEKLRNKFV